LELQLDNVAKKFGSSILFKGLDFTISTGSKVAILGQNGSGKSTLMQMLLGYIQPSKGSISAILNNQPISTENIPFHSSFAAPYMDLPDYLTMQEVINFHFTFKTQLQNVSLKEMAESVGLTPHLNKQIRHFSSGMKQRLKLILALSADAPLLMLDEPCANLDEEGMEWYSNHIQQFAVGRTVIIASNLPLEYAICNQQIAIANYR
jgi:ABC-type multidrug transport system ATPase subunit